MVRCRGGGVFGEEAKKQIVIVTATNHSLGMQKGVNCHSIFHFNESFINKTDAIIAMCS